MKRYIPALIALLILATGCEKSVYRLLYNSMDTFMYRAVTWYIEPTADQDRFLREKIASYSLWHRRSELLKYAATLQGLRERMHRGLREADAGWAQARYRRHEADFFGEIADDVAAFLATLDEKQVNRLEQRMGQRITAIEKKAPAGREERVREEAKSTTRIMEFIYGGLSDRQTEEITRVVRGLEETGPLRMRLFRDRSTEFIALLRSGPDRRAIKSFLGKLALNPEQSFPDYYRKPAELRDRRLTREFLRFDRDLVTPEQRRHAVGKIDMLIATLREIAAE